MAGKKNPESVNPDDVQHRIPLRLRGDGSPKLDVSLRGARIGKPSRVPRPFLTFDTFLEFTASRKYLHDGLIEDVRWLWYLIGVLMWRNMSGQYLYWYVDERLEGEIPWDQFLYSDVPVPGTKEEVEVKVRLYSCRVSDPFERWHRRAVIAKRLNDKGPVVQSKNWRYHEVLLETLPPPAAEKNNGFDCKLKFHRKLLWKDLERFE